jgi:hypothetical protein
MSSDLDNNFTKTQERLRKDAEDIANGTYYTESKLNQIFRFEGLDMDEKKAAVCNTWNQLQEKPAYRDFKDTWIKASATEKEDVQNSYKYACMDIVCLENLARWSSIQLARANQ